MINRRNFLKNASLFTLGGLMAGKVGNAVAAQPATSAAFEATAAKNIGLQIYSLGDELYKDVPGGMKKLKKMGYQTIELAGYGKGKIDQHRNLCCDGLFRDFYRTDATL